MNTRMTPQTHRSIPVIVPPANCFTVLVVDDMIQNRMLLGKVLHAAGYAVIEAKDGAEALKLVTSQNLCPHLIVTDIEMPVMDGITFLRELRDAKGPVSGTPVIAGSGNADDNMQREAIAAGADRFLKKPFDLLELRREIAGLLTSRRRTKPQRFEGNRLDPAPKRVDRIDAPITESRSSSGA
jgi:two-component system chemotaxis response regulator CheY